MSSLKKNTEDILCVSSMFLGGMIMLIFIQFSPIVIDLNSKFPYVAQLACIGSFLALCLFRASIKVLR